MSAEIVKVNHFGIVSKKGQPANLHSICPKENLFLIQIPDLPLRRFAYDAFSVTLGDLQLKNEQIYVRDYMYLKNNLHFLIAQFELSCGDGSKILREYRWKRKFFADPIYHNQKQAKTVFQRLIALPQRELSWRSSLEYNYDEVNFQNGITFVSTVHGPQKPLVLLEIEMASPKAISDILDYRGQIIILTERLENIVRRLSAATLEG
jgi:hypothetical protein